jgi:hypothetical protein
MTRILLALLLLTAGCGGSAAVPTAPAPSGLAAAVPGTPRLAAVERQTTALVARFAPADGPVPVRYELRCELADAAGTRMIALAAGADLAVGEPGSTTIAFAYAADATQPASCGLLAWTQRGYSPAGAALPVVLIAPDPSPSASPEATPDASLPPVAETTFSSGTPLAAYDPVACAATPPAAPVLALRETGSGAPLAFSVGPGRFTRVVRRDGTPVAGAPATNTISPALTGAAVRLRAGDAIEFRSVGGVMAAARLVVRDLAALVDGRAIDPSVAPRYEVTGPGSTAVERDPAGLPDRLRFAVTADLPAGRYLVTLTFLAYGACGAHEFESAALLVDTRP